MELHKLQMLILRELLFKHTARFSELNIEGLSSDHFTYHINTLIEQGLVKKENLKYSLTTKGKEYANTMDTDNVVIEKQPKIAVIVIAYKYIENEKYLVIQERTKEPFFGYVGFITGKIRFGEKITETAVRELKEDAGLEGGEVSIKNIVHDHVFDAKSGSILEDKIFFLTTISNPTGELVDTKSGKNVWMSESEYYKLSKKYYNEDIIYELTKSKKDLDLLEASYLVDEF